MRTALFCKMMRSWIWTEKFTLDCGMKRHICPLKYLGSVQMKTIDYKHYNLFDVYHIYIYMFLIESNLLLIIGFECTKHIGMVYMSAQSIILYLCLHAVHAMIPCGTTTCVMYARQHTESLWCRCQGNGQVHTVVQRIPGYSRHFPHNEAKI